MRGTKRLRTVAVGSALAAMSLAGAATLTSCSAESEKEEIVAAKNQVLTFSGHAANCEEDPRVIAGLVSLEVCVGAEIFFKETFEGNGRTCASCHRAERNFTIDPEFIASLPDDDALFVAEFEPALANLERPEQMRSSTLILENVDGTEPGGPNVRFVLRSVPHNLSMGTSITTPDGQPIPPNERTGWSGDGAPFQGRLADFTSGAIRQHFTQSLDRVEGQDFRFATEEEGQAVATFMIELGRKNEIDLPSIGFSDAGADEGRQRFMEVGCNGCHQNAGANTGAAGTNRNFNTGVEAARTAALDAFPRDGGFGSTPENPDGSFGDQTFNSTPLVEAADTGPFFHTDTSVTGAPAHNTDVAETIEEATAFYAGDAFAATRGGTPLDMDEDDINNIGRFLRGLNAVLNIQMASQRVLGARELGNQFGAAEMDLQDRILALALVEIEDGLRVLSEAPGAPLNQNAQALMNEARVEIQAVMNTTDHGARMNKMGVAFNRLDLADTGISANIQFQMGTGNLMDPGGAPVSGGGTQEASTAELSVNLVTTNDWGGGYCVNLEVTNGASQTTSNWSATLDLNGGAIFNSWNSTLSGDSGTVNVGASEPWGQALGAGTTMNTFGFCANRNGSSGIAEVVDTTANF